MRSESNSRTLLRGILLLPFIFAIAATSSCTGPAGRSESDLSGDAEAQAVLQKVEAETREQKTVSNETFEALSRLREKYPGSVLLRTHLKNAFIYRGDLDGLRSLLLENGNPPADAEERKLLARADVELGRFSEAAPILEGLLKTAPRDVELRGLAGLTYFRLGELDLAAENFDAVWDQVVERKMVPEISIRGLIYLNQGKLAEAKKTLETAASIDPDHISTNNSLSRVYSLLGDEEKSLELSRRVADLQEQAAAKNLVRSRRVAQKIELEAAWENKRYSEVIVIAERLLAGEEDASQKRVLYDYLYGSYKNLGLEAQAEEIRQKAESLAQ